MPWWSPAVASTSTSVVESQVRVPSPSVTAGSPVGTVYAEDLGTGEHLRIAAQDASDERQVVGVHDLPAELRVGVEVIGRAADEVADLRADVIDARHRREAVPKHDIVDTLGERPEPVRARITRHFSAHYDRILFRNEV